MSLRERLYEELKEEIMKRGYKKDLIKFSEPQNGETIKLKGLVLYKIIRSSNPWGIDGIVIYKRITDSALKAIKAVRANEKKKWVGCALFEENYKLIKSLLLQICEKASSTNKSATVMKFENKPAEIKRVPKTKKIK